MKKLLIYYNFIVVSLLVLIGFLGAETFAQLTSAVLFFPLGVYFGLQVIPKKNKAIILPRTKKTKKKVPFVKAEVVPAKKQFDLDRRAFLKLIGSAGITVFLFSLFTKRAQGAFFGSVPGPGTVALKDIAGTQIDPAEKHPTDGYKIAELDDSTPAYYGFTDKDGAWFIMKEGSGGDYRYTKASSDFNNVTTGWPNRANLTYDYFDVVF